MDFFKVISGQGNAASLDVVGDVALGGNVNAGTVTLTDLSVLAVIDGGSLAAGAFHAERSDVEVLRGTLSVAGTATTWFGDFWAMDHAVIRLGGLQMQLDATRTVGSGHLFLDSTSIIEIGNAGTAAAGTVTVDPGALLSINGVDGAVLNNGTIVRGTYETLTNNGSIIGATILSVQNNGSILGGTVQNVTGSGVVAAGLGIQALMLGQGVTQTVQYLQTGSTLTIMAGVTAPTVAGFSQGDTLVVTDAVKANTASWLATGADIGTLSLFLDGTVLASVTLAGDYTGDTFFTQNGVVSVIEPVPCFAEGTLIRTPDGQRAVEALQAGDRVVTCLPHGARTVRWIGHRTVTLAGHPRPEAVLPVRIRAGAFGPATPARDLLLSPDHAVHVEGVLIPIRYLINGTTVRQERAAAIRYFHVELDRHDVLLAEGLPAESYLDTGDRRNFANGGGAVALHPVFQRLAWDAQGCAELVVTGPILDRVRSALHQRAQDVADCHLPDQSFGRQAATA
jgi:hypothetical protein